MDDREPEPETEPEPEPEVEPDQVLDHGLDRAIEAIVMVATEPVTPEVLAEMLSMSGAEVDQRCLALAERYELAGHGFQLVKVAGGWRYQSHPDVAEHVERYVLDGQSARLSGAALETLAIVAYKQPISRAQVASIRGVDPDGVMRTLQARGYIDQIGRDPGPGQAVLWGTTPAFLEKLGLASIADLPALAAFVPGAEVVEALEHGLRASHAATSAPASPSGTPLSDPSPSEPERPASPSGASVDLAHNAVEHDDVEPDLFPIELDPADG